MTSVSGPMKRFSRSVAVIIGIDAYRDDVPPLRCAVADAKALAKTLQRDHGFETWPLLDAGATLSRLVAVLRDQLPAALLPDDRVLFYFAGHGVALDGDRGPAGYLLPMDARRSSHDRFLSMQLYGALHSVPTVNALLLVAGTGPHVSGMRCLDSRCALRFSARTTYRMLYSVLTVHMS